MLVEELMATDVELLEVRDTAQTAAIRMRDANIGFLPIVDDAQQVVGVLTDRDLTVRVTAEALPAKTPVEEVMTGDVIACSPSDELEQAEELMRANQKTRLVVIDESGRLTGVISIVDIVQYENASRAGDIVGDITEREAQHIH